MKTLKQIKDDYAKTQHYGCWNELLLNNDAFTVSHLHLNNIMKIYAMECLKLAYENAEFYQDGDLAVLDYESITNENNIIK